MSETKDTNEAACGGSALTAELAAELANVGWQQGRLLPTDQVMRWPRADRIKAQEVEACMAFAFFTAEDEGRSRVLVARFDSPEECRAAVDEHNRILRERDKAANGTKLTGG